MKTIELTEVEKAYLVLLLNNDKDMAEAVAAKANDAEIEGIERSLNINKNISRKLFEEQYDVCHSE